MYSSHVEIFGCLHTCELLVRFSCGTDITALIVFFVYNASSFCSAAEGRSNEVGSVMFCLMSV